MHPAKLPIDDLLAACDERRQRRSGPGGQHRNKVETAVVLTHQPTGILAEANERRSQQQNREVAIQRLRVRLAIEHREPPAPSSTSPSSTSPSSTNPSPSELWRGRTRGGKLAVNPEHADFPALLAEALDHVAAADWDEAAAAATLGVSRTQLVNLLRLEPAALALLNRERAQRGRAPLR